MTRLHVLFIYCGCFSVFLSPQTIYAQERCGMVAYEEIRHTKTSRFETDSQFEQWIERKINENRIRTFGVNRIQTSTYTIPVVVHIIHNGEPVGTGTNISDVQILSQIQVINDDFKRLNVDRTNTPAEFQAVAGSLDIQFVLAKQDPEGIVTNGITRTLGTKTSWSLCDNSEFKALNYWPAENYLNLWVLNFTGYIGYAQLPVSNLPGLEGSSADRLTDGVVVNYKDFGSTDGGFFVLDPQYNKGRTATHEIGHIFGLRHIWGDGNCATDYVDDTPPQSGQTSGCPSNPQPSCDAIQIHKMFQNYMDYSNDVCMNIFTLGQDARMEVVLQNSPRRLSLLTSPGATDPVLFANDLGIRRIITPAAAECSSPVTPQIEVRNYGTNPITSAQAQLSLNGSVIETKNFSSLNLNTGQLTTLSFNALSFTPTSSQQVSFQITLTNGATDGKSSNNAASVQVTVPITVSIPFVEPFNSLPTGWSVVNPDNDITWANVIAPDNNPTNRAMYMPYSSYDNLGTTDWLVTPSFNVSTPLSTQLRFDVAYVFNPSSCNNGDGLKVYALPGCNSDLSQGILLYSKSGSALATASQNFPFVPNSDAQWRKSEVVSLSTLTGVTRWQLAFVATNGKGNNLYIDNVVINDQVVNDIGLTGIESPGLVHCQTNPGIQFKVKNFSTANIISFQAQRSVNGGNPVSQTFSSSLAVGEEKIFALNAVTLLTGLNQIELTITLPNGLPDTSPGNNILTFNSNVDQFADASPLRQNFDNPLQVPWLIATPLNAKAWELATTNQNQSIVYKAYTNTTLSEESWFVSPVLDLSRYAIQTLFFDLSYAQKVPAEDRLRVLASKDCGLTYKTVLFDQPGSVFSIAPSNSSWSPVSSADWKRQYIGLDSVVGKQNIRLAFIATNAHGNNMYVDNIEIFAGTDSNPPMTSVPYQLYYSTHNSQSDLALTFNLAEKKDVRLQIFSVIGQVVADNLLPDTLNQTYYFDLSIQATGIYLFRLQIDNQVSTTKVYIGH